ISIFIVICPPLILAFVSINFFEMRKILFCKFCQHSIDWKRKNMCSDHIVSKSHVRNKEKFNNNASKTMSLQTCITASSFKSSDSRKELIEDFAAMCAEADIPLEKMTKLRPFLLKHWKQGGAQPENVSSLHQIHLPRVFEHHISSMLKKDLWEKVLRCCG
uniref:U1-type domain-containing protein n=1 Tax=Acanthochromis polyacanthus TaxID=80966 RepID=A0A3Q1GAW2_9TELE